jgi:hypothetical protein
MGKKLPDISKFSFAEMTSNNDGKTSSSGTMGVLICTIGTLCFLLGCLDKIFFGKDIDIVIQSIIFVGIGASLLGYRKSKTSTANDTLVVNQEETTVSPESTVEKTCSTCGAPLCRCQKLNS